MQTLNKHYKGIQFSDKHQQDGFTNLGLSYSHCMVSSNAGLGEDRKLLLCYREGDLYTLYSADILKRTHQHPRIWTNDLAYAYSYKIQPTSKRRQLIKQELKNILGTSKLDGHIFNGWNGHETALGRQKIIEYLETNHPA